MNPVALFKRELGYLREKTPVLDVLPQAVPLEYTPPKPKLSRKSSTTSGSSSSGARSLGSGPSTTTVNSTGAAVAGEGQGRGLTTFNSSMRSLPSFLHKKNASSSSSVATGSTSSPSNSLPPSPSVASFKSGKSSGNAIVSPITYNSNTWPATYTGYGSGGYKAQPPKSSSHSSSSSPSQTASNSSTPKARPQASSSSSSSVPAAHKTTQSLSVLTSKPNAIASSLDPMVSNRARASSQGADVIMGNGVDSSPVRKSSRPSSRKGGSGSGFGGFFTRFKAESTANLISRPAVTAPAIPEQPSATTPKVASKAIPASSPVSGAGVEVLKRQNQSTPNLQKSKSKAAPPSPIQIHYSSPTTYRQPVPTTPTREVLLNSPPSSVSNITSPTSTTPSALASPFKTKSSGIQRPHTSSAETRSSPPPFGHGSTTRPPPIVTSTSSPAVPTASASITPTASPLASPFGKGHLSSSPRPQTASSETRSSPPPFGYSSSRGGSPSLPSPTLSSPTSSITSSPLRNVQQHHSQRRPHTASSAGFESDRTPPPFGHGSVIPPSSRPRSPPPFGHGSRPLSPPPFGLGSVLPPSSRPRSPQPFSSQQHRTTQSLDTLAMLNQGGQGKAPSTPPVSASALPPVTRRSRSSTLSVVGPATAIGGGDWVPPPSAPPQCRLPSPPKAAALSLPGEEGVELLSSPGDPNVIQVRAPATDDAGDPFNNAFVKALSSVASDATLKASAFGETKVLRGMKSVDTFKSDGTESKESTPTRAGFLAPPQMTTERGMVRDDSTLEKWTDGLEDALDGVIQANTASTVAEGSMDVSKPVRTSMDSTTASLASFEAKAAIPLPRNSFDSLAAPRSSLESRFEVAVVPSSEMDNQLASTLLAPPNSNHRASGISQAGSDISLSRFQFPLPPGQGTFLNKPLPGLPTVGDGLDGKAPLKVSERFSHGTADSIGSLISSPALSQDETAGSESVRSSTSSLSAPSLRSRAPASLYERKRSIASSSISESVASPRTPGIGTFLENQGPVIEVAQPESDFQGDVVESLNNDVYEGEVVEKSASKVRFPSWLAEEVKELKKAGNWDEDDDQEVSWGVAM